jgi:DNA modification methylase
VLTWEECSRSLSDSHLYIANASCLDLLAAIPAKTVHLWNCDLPYNISRETGFSHGNNPAYDRLKVTKDFGEWDKVEFPLEESVAEAYRTLAHGGTAIFWYDFWKITDLRRTMEKVGFKQFRCIEWVKTNPTPLNQRVNYLNNAREIAVTGVKGGKPTFHSEYDNGVYRCPIPRAKKGEPRHPTMKPLKLMEGLSLKHSNEGELVGDFCFGSGTAGLAVLNTGRMFIGSEIDAAYFETAQRQLSQAAEKLRNPQQCHGTIRF